MITFACVLRSGGIYTPAWVAALAAGIRRHHAGPCRIVCLTDFPARAVTEAAEVEWRPLLHAWPAWWSKIELFRPGVVRPGRRIVACDLDNVIVGDLAPLAGYDGPFACLRDFYRPAGYGSALMSWTAGEMDHVYVRFLAEGAPCGDPGGDQAFLERAAANAVRLQDVLPGLAVSFKAHCVRGGEAATLPAGARVVCFHGRPKPDAPGMPRFVTDNFNLGEGDVDPADTRAA